MKLQAKVTCFAVCLILAVAGVAPALTVDGSGNITNWGFRPFGTQAGNWTDGAPPTSTGQGKISHGSFSGNGAWTEANNAAPIDYPVGSADFTPSPGGSNGERFDVEFLGWRSVTGNRVSVLGLTSLNPNTGASLGGQTFHVGDVFIDANNDGTYDRVLTAGKFNQTTNDPLHTDDDPFVAGNQTGYSHQWDQGIYTIDDFHGITDQGGYGNNPTIAGATNPFTLMDGENQGGNLDFQSAMFNYGTLNGANENGTWILEWTFDLAALGLSDISALNNLTLHWTTGCGNDFVETQPMPIPEPATLALMGLGLVSIGLLRRRAHLR